MSGTDVESQAEARAGTLPLVVQIGFAGSRRISDAVLDVEHRGEFEQALDYELRTLLGDLRTELGLGPEHFLCGVSSLAAGADLAFARVLRSLDVPHRVFLPERRDVFLGASGSAGPDFSPEERAAAIELLESEHVIEEIVVSSDLDRRTRFDEVNLAIVHESDVLICVLRAGANGRAGGTASFAGLARRMRKPLLILELAEEDGRPVITRRWEGRDHFARPSPPDGLRLTGCDLVASPIPELRDYAKRTADAAKPQATKYKGFFERTAHVVVGAHLFATVCAILASVLHELAFLIGFLSLEAVLLLVGLCVHEYLHHREPARGWAVARSTRELMFSVSALRGFHGRPTQLSAVSYPADFRFGPLMATLCVLQLRSSRRAPAKWSEDRDAYVRDRLDGERGQIRYYDKASSREEAQLRRLRWMFLVCSATAIVCSMGKLTIALLSEGHADVWLTAFGAFAVLLPAAAVAALSVAGALDLKARTRTFRDQHAALTRIRDALADATSANECLQLIIDAETSILGENANWASRRSYTGIT